MDGIQKTLKALRSLKGSISEADVKTAVKLYKVRLKNMSDDEAEKEYGKLVRKYGKRNVDKELENE